MRHYKWVPIAMLIVTASAVALLAIFPLMPVWAVAVVLCLVGLGTGSSYPVVTVSIQNALPHHQIGVAMGAMNFFRALASALVVAIMGAIMLAHLGAAPQRGAVRHSGSDLVAVAANTSGADLVHTFSIIFAVAAGFLVLAVVALILMEERPLRAYVAAPPVVPEQPDKPAEAAE
jgi:MFS family permease